MSIGGVSAIGGRGALPSPSPAPAWDEAWRRKFLELGVPLEQVQQLVLTGAMGMGEAELEQTYRQAKQQIDKEIAKVERKHPGLVEKLEAQSMGDRSILLQQVQQVNAGAMSEDQIEQMMTTPAMTGGGMAGEMAKTMAPWILPGWGALRVAGSFAADGKDPVSKYPIHLDFWNHSGMEAGIGLLDAAMIGGGIFTGVAFGRGLMQAARGAGIIAKTPGVASLAAKQGIKLGGLSKFVPGTAANRFTTAYSRFDDAGIAAVRSLGTSTEHGVLANKALDDILAGRVMAQSGSGVRLTPLGTWPSGRTAIFNRGKPMSEIGSRYGMPTVTFDPRATGSMLPAELAKVGAQRLGGVEHAARLKKVEASAIARGLQVDDVAKQYEHEIFSGAVRDIGVPQLSPLRAAYGKFRPSLTDDAIKAARSETPVLGAKRQAMNKFEELVPNKWARWAIMGTGIGAGAMGAGQLMQKMMMGQMQPQGAENQGNKQQRGPKISKQFEAEAQQFLALPPEQQGAYLQEQMLQVQAAAQQGQLDGATARQLKQRATELSMLEQLAAEAQAAAAPAAYGATGVPTTP